MPNPFLQSVTPLLAVFWGWIVLIIYWTAASLFVRKTMSSESTLQRLQHSVPMTLGLYLILSRHGYFFLYGEV
jgi:hypothetical protein